MIESIETYVLMKCTKCGYQEKVPEWVLKELEFGRKNDSYRMACPRCDRLMLEKSYLDKQKTDSKNKTTKR